MESFKKLGMSENLLRAIHDLGFTEPSEIQEKTIPLVMAGKDVLGSSATGSGKTLAFGSGIIEKSQRGKGIQALILTPTRELAEQVSQSLKRFAKYFKLSITEVYGGVSIVPQIRNIQDSEIVVGTPGRILDHLERRTLDLSRLRFLVLDEADRMLDMGFIDDVLKIINACPKERQTLLFSATIYPDIERIANKYMKSPIFVEAIHYVDPSKLSQIYYDVEQNQKFSLLVHLLKEEKSELVMVFCNTRKNADLVTRNLMRYNLHAIAIHGGLTQNKRLSVLKEFHSKETNILVCTDVAARGLDIKNVSHVYNYDVPKTSTEYVHRIGRTARAGEEGKAITLVSSYDYMSFRNIIERESFNIKKEITPDIQKLFVQFDIRKQFSKSGHKRFGKHFGNKRRDDRGRSFSRKFKRR